MGSGDYLYQSLSDFSGNDRYVLIEGENCYLIFDTFLNDYVEYCTSSNSAYYFLNENAKKIFYAPTYYFCKIDEEVIDLYRNEKLSDIEIATFNKQQTETLQIQRQDSETLLQKADKYSVMKNAMSETPKYIDNAYYFSKMWNNIPNNNSSCTFVALSMLLSYFDCIYSDNVIEESYDRNLTIYSLDSFSSISIDAFGQSPGAGDDLHNYLLSLARQWKYVSYDSSTINMTLMDDFLTKYFQKYKIEAKASYSKITNGNYSYCTNAIDNNYPIIIAFDGPNPLLPSENTRHAVVGYGYDSTGFYVHMGWRISSNMYPNPYNCNVNKRYVQYAAFAEINEEHVCSDNYRWNINGGTGSVCPCGKISCNHDAGANCVSANSTKHNYLCKTCGEVVSSENHTFVANGYDQICSKCSYVKKHTHSYTYTPLKLSRHKATCTICGTTKTEACTPVNASIMSTRAVVESHCLFCGQQLPVLNPPQAAQQQIAETFRALAAPQLPAMLP